MIERRALMLVSLWGRKRFKGHVMLGDRRKFCEQQGDAIG